jgi:hypothetical protein
MITFNVVKEQHGWAIRMGERMTMPFWSRDLAVREANCLADAIRCHGECTEVIVEGAEPNEPARGISGSNSLDRDSAGAPGGLRSDMSDVQAR